MLEDQIKSSRKKADILFHALQKAKLEVHDSSFLDITSSACSSIRRDSSSAYSGPGSSGTSSRSNPNANFNSFLKPYRTLSGHFDKVNDICWSSDSKYLVSMSQDGFIIVWDPVTGYKKYAIPLQNKYALCCKISQNNTFIASAGLDNTCTIYKLYGDSTSNINCILAGHSAYILDCVFQHQTEIITASGDMSCALWDYLRGVKISDFYSHNGDVLCLASNEAFHPSLFASGSSDGTVKIWDCRQAREVQNFQVSDSDINSISFFPGGNSFAAGTDDGMVNLYDLRSDCKLVDFNLREKIAESAAQLQPSPYLESIPRSMALDTSLLHNDNASSSSVDLKRRYMNVYSNLYTPGVNNLDFSRLGRLLFTCYSNFGCVVWDILKAVPVGTLPSHSNKVSNVATSPDGLGVATSLWDSTVKIWSI